MHAYIQASFSASLVWFALARICGGSDYLQVRINMNSILGAGQAVRLERVLADLWVKRLYTAQLPPRMVQREAADL